MPPLSPHRTAAREILTIIPLVMRTIGSELRHSGTLTVPGHLGLLFVLSQKPHNLSELAQKHNVSLPTMSNTISGLVERGLVQRTRASHDRRQVIIELTAAGQAVLDEIVAQAEAHVAEIIAPLKPEELDQLLTGLSLLRAAFTR